MELNRNDKSELYDVLYPVGSVYIGKEEPPYIRGAKWKCTTPDTAKAYVFDEKYRLEQAEFDEIHGEDEEDYPEEWYKEINRVGNTWYLDGEPYMYEMLRWIREE